MLRMVTTLLASSSSARARPSGRARRRPATSSARCSTRKVTDRGDIAARAAELGADLSERRRRADRPRAVPRAAQSGDWRARVLTLALRAVRAISPGALAAEGEHGGEGAEVVAIVPDRDDEQAGSGRRGAGERARAGADRVRGHRLAQPHRRRPGGPLPRRAGGAPRGERRRGRGRAPARLRGHRRLPPAAAGDERGPGRARALLRRDGRAAGRLRRAVRDRPAHTRSRPISTTTATSPPPPRPSSPTATRSATGSSAPRSSAATTSPRPRAARSSASASRRCGCSGSRRRRAPPASPVPKRAGSRPPPGRRPREPEPLAPWAQQGAPPAAVWPLSPGPSSGTAGPPQSRAWGLAEPRSRRPAGLRAPAGVEPVQAKSRVDPAASPGPDRPPAARPPPDRGRWARDPRSSSRGGARARLSRRWSRPTAGRSPC